MENLDTEALFGDGEEAGTGPRPILSKKEIEEAKRIARERVAKALQEAERERIIADEMERLRREEGKRTGAVDQDEPVTFTVDLAEFSDRLRINGKEYFHGYTYTEPRHVFNSLREIMFKGHLHQANLDGKDLSTFYRSKSQPQLSGKEAA
jgi:hypothetical protein